MRRTKHMFGKFFESELEKVKRDAEAAGLDPAAYVRRRLKLPDAPQPGAPKGNVNNPFGRKGRPDEPES